MTNKKQEREFYLSMIMLTLVLCLCLFFFAYGDYFERYVKRYGITKPADEAFSRGAGLLSSPSHPIAPPVSVLEFIGNIQSHQKILEIGPFDQPHLKGKNVKYFDIMTQQEIQNEIGMKQNNDEAAFDANSRYGHINMNAVPVIDFVNPTGDMSGIDETFDIVFSAHNLEHQIDLIQHLSQVYELLNPGGCFYLIIPDKRYCFDHFIPESPLSDILGQHFEAKQQAHNLRTILAMCCETTHNCAQQHWRGQHGVIGGSRPDCYLKALELFKRSEGAYMNAHRWRFTPLQFSFIIHSLREMGLTSFDVEQIYDTELDSNQFMVMLRKSISKSEK